MTMNNESAEILDMEDARARRRSEDSSNAEFRHAGAHLAAIRETRGLTRAETAAKIHIKENHLAAIEDVDSSALPARPYAIGFVKTYAEFLELDAAAVVARFKEDAGYVASAPVDVEKFEAAEAAVENENREMSLAAVIAVTAFIVWCAWQITRPHEVTVLGGSAPENAAPAPFFADPTQASALTDIVEARIVERIDPVYPRDCAVSAQATEAVVVSFNITAQGRVAGERIAQSSNACFNAAALNAIRRWRFAPRKVDGAARTAFDQKMSFSFERPR